MNISRKAGFTLVELMVTIAIIGVLTAIITANFSSARSRSRDAKRISDLGAIQLALTFYFDRCNQYPATLTDSTPCPAAGLTMSTFISKIPTPPSPAGLDSSGYRYNNNGGFGTATDYVLGTQLESNNSALIDDIDGNSATTYNVNCDDTTFNYCIGPK